METVSRAGDGADVERHLHGNLDRHISSTFFHLDGRHRRLCLGVQRRLLCPRRHGAGHSETDVVAVDDQLGHVRDLDDGRAVRRQVPDAHREHVLSTQGKANTQPRWGGHNVHAANNC